MMRRRKFLFALAVFLLAAFTAQGYGAYLGYAVEGEYVFVDGVRLHYSDQGSGEPVILLHGYGMNIDITWRDSGVIDTLSKQYRVIAMDMRGHGFSDKPYGENAYGTEMARDVVRLMDSLGIERAHLVGNSMGGLVAIKAATLFPQRLLSLTTCGMGWARYEGEKREVVDNLAASIEAGEGLEPLIRFLRGDDQPGWMELSAIDAFVGYLNDEQALGPMTRKMPELAVSEADLRALKLPVLALVAEHDPLMSDVEDLAPLVPNFCLVKVEGRDHFNLPSAPKTQETLAAFLSGAPVEAAAGMS
jgi:pimeloyl-ACP methyl ester carboxylesterase